MEVEEGMWGTNGEGKNINKKGGEAFLHRMPLNVELILQLEISHCFATPNVITELGKTDCQGTGHSFTHILITKGKTIPLLQKNL